MISACEWAHEIHPFTQHDEFCHGVRSQTQGKVVSLQVPAEYDAGVHAVDESGEPGSTVILDGKAIKRVAKRLRPLRGLPGGLLGGRALVALEYRSGLAVALHAHPDGDANDVRFVADLVPRVRQCVSGPRLWLGDSA